MECDAFLQNQMVFLDDKDEEQNATTMTVDIAIPSEIGDACDSHQFELTWRLYIDNQSNMRNIHGKMVGFPIAIGRISLLLLLMMLP